MEASISKHLLIGLPSTGKTTFLAAFWHIVDSDQVPGSLSLKKLHGDRNHLNAIRDRWLRCEAIGRTVQSGESIVSMRLVNPANHETTEVLFPDMSGETFNLHWLEKRWSKEYDLLVSEASGVLLFIHPGHVIEPVQIREAEDLVQEIRENGDDSDEDSSEETIPWNADSAATQVKLVGLLQFFVDRRSSRPVFKVCVIISAWDLVVGEGQSPEKWLSRRLPLLDQYLKANSELFPTEVFGVSAQGGDLSKEGESLRRRLRPSKRVIVIGPGYEGNDITTPVKWLMS